ncbi:MAG: LysE family translocator [Candidatus Amoebophilus sp.]
MLELGISYIIAAMIPGPSMALVIRNGILHSRLASLQAAFGIVVGTALQSGIILIGLNFISDYPMVIRGMKMVCACYLIYLGLKSIFSSKIETKTSLIPVLGSNQVNKKKQNYFTEGLLVEILNPLAFTFFISILAINYNPQQTSSIKIMYWLELILLAFLWFIMLSFVSSSKAITTYTKKYNRILDVVAGILFIFFGIQQFFS